MFGSWNVANVTSIANIFNGASAFNQDLSNWSLHNNVNLSNALSSTGLDCDNYSSTLIGWADNGATPGGRSIGANGLLYGNNALASRNYLINTLGWTISGDAPSGFDCPLILSVEWLSFTARNAGQEVILKWQTASETNNAYFEVEYSTDGVWFFPIGQVAGGGTTLHLKPILSSMQTLNTERITTGSVRWITMVASLILKL
ncbi:MAG: BspA family leucine-rich repeat surface protein [Saprospiraceae bacterium]